MRTHDATAMGGGFPITDDDTFAVADSSDGGFSLRRIRVGDTDKDGMPGVSQRILSYDMTAISALVPPIVLQPSAAINVMEHIHTRRASASAAQLGVRPGLTLEGSI